MKTKNHSTNLLGMVYVALCLAALSLPAGACELQIIWQADLAAPHLAAVITPVSGTAGMQFDFVHPGATIKLELKNPQDVRVVELHVARSYSDHAGPVVMSLYEAADGPLPAILTRHVTEADLMKQVTPKIAEFTDLVQAVLNGRAYVTVATKTHPEGEFSGFVTMHKEAIYTDTPGNITHDPKLIHDGRN